MLHRPVALAHLSFFLSLGRAIILVVALSRQTGQFLCTERFSWRFHPLVVILPLANYISLVELVLSHLATLCSTLLSY